jgi:Peptidase M15
MNKKLLLLLGIVLVVVVVYVWRKGHLGNVAKSSVMKNFKIEEFDSPAVSSEYGVKDTYSKRNKQYLTDSAKKSMDSRFLSMIDAARSGIERGWNKLHPSQRIVFSVTSGLRTKAYNDKIYEDMGKPPTNSAHIYGKAADISWGGYNDDQKREILAELYAVGFRRFGIANSFVHVDNADAETGHSSPAIWGYGGSQIVSTIAEIEQLNNI